MSREENAGDCGDCSHCLMCGCDRDDHFEPDPYDMGNAELDAAGHLNHCGVCRECFGPEFASAGLVEIIDSANNEVAIHSGQSTTGKKRE